MRERAVADVMQQRRKPNQASLGLWNVESSSYPCCYMKNAQGMAEPGVRGARVHKVGKCQLPQTSQSLKYRCIHDTDFIRFPVNEAMYWITNFKP
jgi:Cu/Zn superoxide dismutase